MHQISAFMKFNIFSIFVKKLKVNTENIGVFQPELKV